MKIALGWPSPTELIANEMKTLDAMRNNSNLLQAQGDLVKSANDTYLRFNKKLLKAFSFNSWVYFSNSPIVNKASIECLINTKLDDPKTYNMLTYSFGLFKPNGKEDWLVKRFHIDFISAPSTGHSPQHPIFHLQTPGKLSPMLKEKGITDKHLEPSLSEPRLCCAPTTLALLTDFLLREFGGDRVSHLTKFGKDSYWRGLIKRDEELVLRPYFNACKSFFDKRATKIGEEYGKLFSQDFVYGSC